MKTMSKHFRILASGAAMVLLALGQAASAANPAATVVIDNFAFSPAKIEVSAGTTVTWDNHDDMPHMIVSTDKPRAFMSPPVDSGEHFSTVFAKPGTYTYFCSMHPRMTGTVVVK
jgi:plastocyanin